MIMTKGAEREREVEKDTEVLHIFDFFQLDDAGRFLVLITSVEWVRERKSRMNSRFCFGFEETKLSLEKCRLRASGERRKSERAKIN